MYSVDIDECKDPLNVTCGAHSTSCKNMPGSYMCVCDTGYVNKNNNCEGE